MGTIEKIFNPVRLYWDNWKTLINSQEQYCKNQNSLLMAYRRSRGRRRSRTKRKKYYTVSRGGIRI